MQSNQLSDVWLKASVLGSLWAASEIILGSFLHALHIPFKGSILTGIGLILMISVSYMWKDKGLFWRSGVICALMKALSPSAVIFGPMIAIFIEAILFEVSVRFLGRNITGFITGSVLAMAWVIVQKFLNLLLYYGNNLVQIYKGIVIYLSNQLNINYELSWEPLILISVIYLVTGVTSAIIGMLIGRNIKIDKNYPFSVQAETELLNKRSIHNTFKYSIIWLCFSILAIPAGLMSINWLPFYVWIPIILILIVFWVIRYKHAMRRLLKPRFWISFMIITLLATFFLTFVIQNISLMEALLTGIQMNFRAILIALGFSVVGTELYNPVFQKFFNKSRFRNISASLSMAIESLPMFIANIPDVRLLVNKPSFAISNLLQLAEKRFIEISKPFPHIEIISGPVASGKTSSLITLIEYYRSQGIKCGGFYSRRVMEEDQTIGYDLVSVATDESMPFLRKANHRENPEIGKYIIMPEALSFGESLLKQSVECEIIIIDELGKLELSGKGWFNALQVLQYTFARKIIAVARLEVVKEIEQVLNYIVQARPTIK